MLHDVWTFVEIWSFFRKLLAEAEMEQLQRTLMTEAHDGWNDRCGRSGVTESRAESANFLAKIRWSWSSCRRN